ncbi:MAG: UvrD-helicase domain-containing protein [Oscillospiraceae bacterium]|jgi:DNA helicase-2/ATP-dependent DNA helicase PcrA|nr:UvrD-helicase domain-containing protein [Oscillospiraceae bacterium]
MVVGAIDASLTSRGLVRNRDNIEIAFDRTKSHSPFLQNNESSHMSFHCSFSVISGQAPNAPSFCILNGRASREQKNWLDTLEDISQFNKEQYLVEHAAPEKNIVIRAGAGTGKTHTMISRIGFICYTQNVPLQKMADRIVMITFTNEAADQMEEKLKTYFRNCYLITSKSDYLQMISRIDHMQISTIHSYAKNLIAQLGASFGYGIDLGITSSEFYRRKKTSDLLDAYIHQKELEYGKSYTDRLGMPIYAIREGILDFISKLHNKSVNIGAIESQDFGFLLDGDTHIELHELFASVIPAVEREYFKELLENNKIHLSAMMSILNRFINDPDSESRIVELKKDKCAQQFMFVDEFQDTDDSQIESLLKIAQILDYRLFLVGDIKQCIYRFRGAKEKAFDQLKIDENPEKWLEFSLQRNYRTDKYLLDIFDLSFASWGARDDELLSYEVGKDKLIGTRDFNGKYLANKSRFFRRLPIANEELRIPILVEEIRRLQKRIQYEENQGVKLSSKEKSIAILVRENWQADMVRTECARLGISVHTNTGGDLYMSQPALDMLTLVNALVHFDEADYLYNLVTSNFFNLDIPKSNLYEIRMKIRTGGWRAKTDENEQVNYLINFMNLMLANTVDKNNKWEYIVASLRTQPILQAIRKVYGTLEPWKHFSDDPWKQHYYQLNVDLLFEQVINACNVDRLTINTLQEHLYNSMVSQVSIDSRIPATDETDVAIQCITVHKSKGLEYGHVIMPFCSASINYIKKSQLHISTTKYKDRYRIGYSMSVGDFGESVQNHFYDEIIEKSEKAREEARILYVAMTRSIRSFSWVEMEGKQNLSWQNLIETEV